MIKNMIAHKWLSGSVDIRAGYTIKANSSPMNGISEISTPDFVDAYPKNENNVIAEKIDVIVLSDGIPTEAVKILAFLSRFHANSMIILYPMLHENKI